MFGNGLSVAWRRSKGRCSRAVVRHRHKAAQRMGVRSGERPTFYTVRHAGWKKSNIVERITWELCEGHRWAETPAYDEDRRRYKHSCARCGIIVWKVPGHRARKRGMMFIGGEWYELR